MPLVLNTALEVLARVTRRENEIKSIQAGKRSKTASTCRDMVLHIENPKEATHTKTQNLLR